MATQTSTVKPARLLFGDVQALIDRLTLRPRGEFRAGATRLRSLTASLTRDLVRFGSAERGEATIELLKVMAGAVRHSHALRLFLQRDDRCCELTVFPRWGVVHMAGDHAALLLGIDGHAAYRVTPASTLELLDMSPAQAAAVAPLHAKTVPAHEIARWPGMCPTSAARLINGL